MNGVRFAWTYKVAAGLYVASLVVVTGWVVDVDAYGTRAAVYALGAGTMFSVNLIPSGVGREVESPHYKWRVRTDILLVMAIVIYTWLSASHWLLDELASGSVGGLAASLCLAMSLSCIVVSTWGGRILRQGELSAPLAIVLKDVYPKLGGMEASTPRAMRSDSAAVRPRLAQQAFADCYSFC